METDDGYVLRMHRIPNRDSKDAVFFVHGIADTATGWVSNGLTSSHAFAAYEAGFDVYLCDCRGCPPRERAPGFERDPYWRYTVDAIGLEDIKAFVEGVHGTKEKEGVQGCKLRREFQSKLLILCTVPPPLS